MNTKEYIKSLFSDYEETVNLKDFMEELQSNLDARIANLVRKGLAEKEAFDKACTELGDISILAKELSLKKRREVFEEAYMDIRNYMSTKQVFGYVAFGLLTVSGLIIAAVSFFAAEWWVQNINTFGIDLGFIGNLGILSSLGVLMPFIVVSISGFTFLGLIQETSSHYPMGKKRALWYALAAGLISFGLFMAPITYFSIRNLEGSYAIMSAIAVLLPFGLGGGGLLSFLVLSEKERFKPWAASLHEKAKWNEIKIWSDPVEASRFGMICGAIYILGFALFFLFGFLVGFRYSWLVFLFATGVQLLVQGLMMKKSQSE